MNNCPCGSGILYVDCCESIIKHQSATTALELMKSRYVAYCIADADYLYDTVHSKTRKQQNKAEIAHWSTENIWNKLEILNCDKGEPHDISGTVEFKAYYKDSKGFDQLHYEKSNFCKENNKWFYVDGVFDPQKPLLHSGISRNDLCKCGSGKKFKKCCW